MEPATDGFNVHVGPPVPESQFPHTSGVADPHVPVNITAVPTVPLEDPEMEHLGVVGPPLESVHVIEVPLPEQVTLLGSEIVSVVCACAPKPRVMPHAADAAHNRVRKRIMNLSLYPPVDAKCACTAQFCRASIAGLDRSRLCRSTAFP
jgi:hypothetical protein